MKAFVVPVVLASLLLAQTPAPAGHISGRVVDDAETPAPVRNALVMLQPSSGGDGLAVVTDRDGRFSLGGVPAGRYTLTAQKAAYLANSYGAKRPGRPGVTLVVTAGQSLPELSLVLPRGSVITGRLTQPDGAPFRETQVIAIPAGRTGGGAFDSRARVFHSDDQGDYRIWGLAPGEYLVAALPPLARTQTLERTRAENDALLQRLAARQAGVAVAPSPSAPPQVRGYAPVYFPGTAVAAHATIVQVGRAETKYGIDMQIAPFPLARISGSVRGVNGEATQAVSLALEPVGPPLPASAAAVTSNRRPDASGRFVFDQLPPGTYRLTARGGGVTFRDGGVETNDANQVHWATETVIVDGHDINGLAISLGEGRVLSGRLVALAPDATPALAGAQVTMTPRGTGAPPRRSVTVAADGAFAVTGLHAASWELSVTLPPALAGTWGVQSITREGVDIRDQPIRMDAGDLRDVVIGISPQRSAVTGTLSTAGGAPATDYFIVIFPADRALWHETSPRVQVVRPSLDGAFSARDLPAGTYRLAAVTDVEDDEWRRMEFLESLHDASVAIDVKAGATTRQDLRISR